MPSSIGKLQIFEGLLYKDITKRRNNDKFFKYYENEIYKGCQNQGCYNQGITVAYFQMESMKNLRFMAEEKPNFLWAQRVKLLCSKMKSLEK